MSGFVDFAHGIKHQVGRGTQNGALGGSRAVDKFVHAGIILKTILENVDDRFVAEERDALGVGNGASGAEQQSVSVA